MKPIVHVVEDDRSVRSALTRLLKIAGFEARGYSSAGEFLVSERDATPGCIVLDVGLPGLTGIELQAALQRERDPRPVIFLTGRGNIDMGVTAMKAGAVDFLTKPVDRERLLGAVETALQRGARAQARDDEERILRERLDRLTAREREVFDRVVQGKLNKQIAFELGTSVRTVKAHRAQVMRKMEVGSLAELVSASDRLFATA
ncbi:Response regulator protein TodT [Usitatibacter rugosus]|uniref:Response regulator protein TodT n=1 Tax=Usitatibacter rugosus TaxID=2732067 RepID=A0A6M4GV12_9PROT|nr:response regulator [Usitatibacter rugosus]QJR10835.1 Response regulator protein TodT [Usitatibacter rugosus]